jgi:ATP-binding cassette subfamily B protein
VIIGVLFAGVLQIKQMRIIERIQQRIFTRLTFAYAYRIPKLSLPSVDNYYLPELVNRFFDTASLQKGLSKLLLDFPAATIQILFGLILLSLYHPVFIVFGFLLAILVVVIFYVTSPKGFSSSIRESDFKYDVAHWLEEISRSIKTFKYFQHTDLHLKKTDNLVNGYLESREEHFSVLVFQYRIVIGFKVFVTAAMLIIGAVLFVNQQINIGQFIATEIIILTITGAIEKLIVSLEVIYDVLTSLEKINKVLEKPQDIDKALIETGSWKKTDGLDIKIKELNFGFTPNNDVLKNLNLHIKSGEKVCITGSEGSGKSSFLKLLTGMWPDYRGNLLFNDVPFKSMVPETLFRQVALYFDENELFSGTLLNNLTLGAKEVNFTDLQFVCDLVGLSDFIASKQEGYAVKLDPQGKKLSSNIAQKILLARCIYQKPALMLLEDGWLGIDGESKTRIIEYLTSKDNKTTLIAISDDKELVAKCTRQITLTKGSII